MKLNNLLVESLEKDTRDQTDLFVYRTTEKLSSAKFKALREFLKDHKTYYSGFKKGFISKNKLDVENLTIDLKVVKSDKKTSKRISYFKTLLEYTDLESVKTYLKEYSKHNYNKYYMYGRYENHEQYYNELVDNLEHSFRKDKDSYSNNLRYIRDAIVWKSLKLDKEQFRANGYELYYLAIWDKLPVIDNLEMTNKAYTAVWGYDQTNVSIAYLLNKKFNGLNVLVDINEKHIYFTRLKDNSFSDKDGVRYFTEDPNPNETFKADASVTGQYR